MKQKTYKALAKRVRITKKGRRGKKAKIIHIAAGRDHFNARESGNTTRGKRRRTLLSKSFRKSVKTMIPNIS